MKSRTHTHRGSCQICGRDQAVDVKTGLIAKHGYTVQWGFFSGTCFGSGFRAFEVATDAIAEAVAMAQRKAVQAKEDAAELRKRTDLAGYHRSYEKDSRGRSVNYRVDAEFRDTAKKFDDGYVLKGVEVVYRPFRSVWDSELKESVRPEKVEDARAYGKNAAQMAAASREEVAKSLDAVVAEVAQYVAWQKDRVAKWKPAALRPVAVEPTVKVEVGTKFKAYDQDWTVVRFEYSRRSLQCRPVWMCKNSDGRVCEFQPHQVKKFVLAGA